MTSTETPGADRPYWTFAGLGVGVGSVLPVMPGMFAFGAAVGATSARKGLSLVDTVLMNLSVFGGASQLVALEVWPQRVTLASMAALALITATVNARMLLMGASLQPWLGRLPAWQIYPMLHLTTDPGWLVAMRYRGEGGNDAAVFLGGSLILWLGWNLSAAVGYLIGSLLADPRAIGLDLVMPIFFGTMLISLWRGRRRATGWMVAGAVALVTEYLVSGWWFVVTGAIAGSVAEGWHDERV